MSYDPTHSPIHEDKTVDRGLHVYMTLAEAQSQWSLRNSYDPSIIVIPLTAYIEDFMGSDGNVGAFTKLFFTKKAYDKAVRGKSL